jgi:hypothetical protein
MAMRAKALWKALETDPGSEPGGESRFELPDGATYLDNRHDIDHWSPGLAFRYHGYTSPTAQARLPLASWAEISGSTIWRWLSDDAISTLAAPIVELPRGRGGGRPYPRSPHARRRPPPLRVPRASSDQQLLRQAAMNTHPSSPQSPPTPTLRGRLVSLEPLNTEHADALVATVDPEVWRWKLTARP